MKASLFLIVFGMGLALPATGETELETLRERCALQERQIQRLEAEIETLREGKSAPAAATGWTTPKASAPAKEDSTEDDPAKEDPAKGDPAKEIPAKAAPVTEAPAKAVPAGATGYTVRAGDNLDKIARKNGTTAEKLAEANDLKLTSILQIGQKLVLPAKGKARSTTETPATRKTDDPKPSKSSTADEETLPVPPKTTVTPPASHAGTTPKTPSVAATKADTPPPAKTVDKKKTHAVKIESEMTYGEFAAKHGTDIRRLNDLNGLDLTKSAVLAKGSELYVPGQP